MLCVCYRTCLVLMSCSFRFPFLLSVMILNHVENVIAELTCEAVEDIVKYGHLNLAIDRAI